MNINGRKKLLKVSKVVTGYSNVHLCVYHLCRPTLSKIGLSKTWTGDDPVSK